MKSPRSASVQLNDHQLLSSLLEIKSDLSAEVRALTKRMSHIDEQIGQIFNFLSPLNTSTGISNLPNVQATPQPSPPIPPKTPSPISGIPLLPSNTAVPSEMTAGSVTMSPLFDVPSFYSDVNAKMSLFDDDRPIPATPPTDMHDLPRQSRISDQMIETLPTGQLSSYDTPALSIPSPQSAYNRSASSSIASLGASTTSRSSTSNKIAPAPMPSSPVNPKHPLSSKFQPISNTRFNPGRSPKPKTRSHHSRTSGKHQQPDKSTIIELDSPTQESFSSKNAPLLSATGKTTTAKPGGNVFRRFLAGGSGGGNTEKTAMLSSPSNLLYPPTSDDEHPTSPASSGNDDDDYRLLTSTSSKFHHQTPL